MRVRPRCVAWAGTVLAGCLAVGCTAPSEHVALAAQRRATEVQQAVADRQHAALRVLLYRDLLRRLEADRRLTEAQRTALSEVWNDRDLLEFWQLQFERANALRLVGVDAKLFADQSPVELLIKAVETKADRVQTGLAAAAGKELTHGNE